MGTEVAKLCGGTPLSSFNFKRLVQIYTSNVLVPESYVDMAL